MTLNMQSLERISSFFLSHLLPAHCYCTDHNNVSGGAPFHGHSSETELHKPFTTRSVWWMAVPPAKPPRPDRSVFSVKNITRKTKDTFWFLFVLNENVVVIRKMSQKDNFHFCFVLCLDIFLQHCIQILLYRYIFLFIAWPAFYFKFTDLTRRWSSLHVAMSGWIKVGK